jgi:hypothetical protein
MQQMIFYFVPDQPRPYGMVLKAIFPPEFTLALPAPLKFEIAPYVIL